MKKKLLWITETAIMLALLVTLQALTKGFSQIVTGTCVNVVLAVAVLVGGMGCGVTVALISPILAYLLGIAPNLVTVPAIMVGNTVYVLLLYFIAGKNSKQVVRQVIAWLVSAAAKFASLYAIVVLLICGVLSESLMAAGTLKPPMLEKLPAMFTWPQLITALIGGAIALLIVPVLRKALHK